MFIRIRGWAQALPRNATHSRSIIVRTIRMFLSPSQLRIDVARHFRTHPAGVRLSLRLSPRSPLAATCSPSKRRFPSAFRTCDMLRKMLPLVLVALALGSQAATSFGPEYPVSRPVYGAPAGQQRAEAVATDGNDFVIAWNDQANERTGLYVSKLTAAGALAQQTAVRSGLVRDVSIVWAGDGYLVAWNDDLAGTAMMARLSRQLELVMAPQPLSDHVRLFAFAS